MAELSLGRRVDGLRTSGPVRSVTEGGVGGDWITLLLHILVMATTASSILRVEEGARSSVLVPLAVGGLVIGFVLARTPALDAISHLLALFVGVVAALAATAARADGATVVWNSHGRALYDLAERIVLAQVDREPRRLPDGDLIAIIGVTIWLVGYSSGWMLYRRRWLLPALVVPATLVFVSLRFEDAEPSGALAVFALASLIMAARHNAFTRQLDWTRRRMPAPRGLPGRFTVCGIVIAAFALAAGWALPYQGPRSIVDDFGGKADKLWSWVQDRSEDVGLWPGGGVGSSGFNDFTDSFTIGEQFNPSPDPVATFDGEPGTYLAVRRWDFYSGHGWKSDVDAQFRMEGEDEDVRVTDVTFEPSGTVVLSPSVGSLRRVNTGEVTVLKGQGGLLYTTDTYIRAGIPVFTVMGWLHFDDEAIDIESIPIETVHIQLQDLVRRLRGAEFIRDPDTGLPRIADPEIAAEIELARVQLGQLPMEFSFAYGTDDQVLLLLSGRLPNYDDIEAVYANVDDQEEPPERYEVNGSESVASEEELRAAGTDYPSWVTERYLQLPDSTTDETRALAAQVVDEDGATMVFDQAWAIQQFLRDETQFKYELNSDQAPSNRDLVDFFLFGKKQGRCEEFATAMVVMLRSVGVPARLVGGYRASDELTERGEFLYREEQAHTWVEVFFPGYGWIPFEPTPNVADPFDYPGEGDAQQQPDQLPEQSPEPTPTPESPLEPTPEATPGFAEPPADGANSDGGGLLSNGLGLVTLGLTAVAAAIFGGLTLAWIWGLRGLRPGAALYTRAIRVGRLFGIEPHPTMTPREYAVEFGRTVPRAGRAVAVVADIYSAERYGGIEITEDAKRGGDRAWHDVRAAALRWRPWRKRLKG